MHIELFLDFVLTNITSMTIHVKNSMGMSFLFYWAKCLQVEWLCHTVRDCLIFCDILCVNMSGSQEAQILDISGDISIWIISLSK